MALIEAAGITRDGQAFLMLTLEPSNVARLTAMRSEPISVRVGDMFPDGIPSNLELLIDYTDQPVAAFNAGRGHAEVSFDERPLSAPKRAHCPECKSTVEQLGVFKNDTPIAMVMCSVCGCVLGTLPASAVATVKADTDRALASAHVIVEVAEVYPPECVEVAAALIQKCEQAL